jgi:hypothetical protein
VDRFLLGQFVHCGFAREMVSGGRESAIGTLAQRRLRGMELDYLIVDVVGSLNSGAAGIVIMEFPGVEFSVGSNSTFDFDDAGGTKIGPVEFLFGPDNFYGAICGAPRRRLQSGVGGVFSSVGGASIRNNHRTRSLGRCSAAESSS